MQTSTTIYIAAHISIIINWKLKSTHKTPMRKVLKHTMKFQYIFMGTDMLTVPIHAI